MIESSFFKVVAVVAVAVVALVAEDGVSVDAEGFVN